MHRTISPDLRFKALVFLSIAVMALALLMIPRLAFAADGTTISLNDILQPFAPFLGEVLTVLIGALVAWIGVRFNRLTGLKIDTQHRDALQTALTNGALFGLHKAEGLAKTLSINVESEILIAAAQYVKTSAPDALKHFGVTPEKLAEMIRSRLPDMKAVSE